MPRAAAGLAVHPDLRPPDGRHGRGQRARRPGLWAADRGGTDPGTADPRCRGAGPSRVGYCQPAAGRTWPGPCAVRIKNSTSGRSQRCWQRRDGSEDGHELVRARADRDRRSHHRAGGERLTQLRGPHTAHSRPKHCSRIRASLSRSRTRCGGRASITDATVARTIARTDENPTAAPHSTLTLERTPFPSPSATATASPTPAPSPQPRRTARSRQTAGDASGAAHSHSREEYSGGNTCRPCSNCNRPKARSNGDFVRSLAPAATPSGPGPARHFAWPRSGRDFARPRSHFTGPRVGFAPWSFARTTRLAAIRAPNMRRKAGEKDSGRLSFAAPSKPKLTASRDRRCS